MKHMIPRIHCIQAIVDLSHDIRVSLDDLICICNVDLERPLRSNLFEQIFCHDRVNLHARSLFIPLVKLQSNLLDSR